MPTLKNNLTLIITGAGVIIVLVLIAVLIILDKDPSAYVGSIGTIVTVLVSAGLLGNRINVVSKNVNGNQSRLLEENARLREVALAPITSGQEVWTRRPVNEVAPELMSEDTIQRISDDKDRLPKHSA